MLIKILSASWDFHGGPVAKTPHSLCRGLGSIPGQGARSCMPQPRSKILRAATKAWCSQTIFFFKG